MQMSSLSRYVNRTSQFLRDATAKVMLMYGADEPSRAPKTLFTFNTAEEVAQIVKGSDADIGGFSTVNFELEESPEINASIGRPATGKLWGEMRLGVKPALKGKIRAGYAGFRNQFRTTLFGEMCHDVSMHNYLALRVRVAGDPRTRHSYFVNIQTDTPVSTDLWQHRLYFHKADNSWEDLFIPFDSFILTNSGGLYDNRIEMFKKRIRSVGISVLGGNSCLEGHYELGVDSIRIVNEEDVIRPQPAGVQHQHQSPVSH
ncbi:hypothetical protein HGRIS_003592 [Hohenbuehelia grisea]|uniref:NADH:ubiquinone oxidoreductase intermediate-associated protein 30 domain-containing protein n=1 Tax=Hohenbuehelia grisea TaxID=104357 RepID=A0ABR3JGI5_9AGAR